MTSISSMLRNPKITRTALPLVVYLVLTLLPTPEGLTPVGQRAFALVVAGILTFSMQPIDIAISVPLFVLLAVPAGIFSMGEAMSSFMGPAFIFVFAMVCLAISFEKSGLTRRIALFIVSKSGGSPKRLLFLFIATATLCSSVLADIPVLVMLFPICLEIIKKNDCNVRGSNFAQSLLLGIGSGCFLGGMATPAGSAANPTSIQILEQATGLHISFMEWAAIGMPIVLLLIPCVWLSFVILMPSEIKQLKGMDHFEEDMKQWQHFPQGKALSHCLRTHSRSVVHRPHPRRFHAGDLHDKRGRAFSARHRRVQLETRQSGRELGRHHARRRRNILRRHAHQDRRHHLVRS